jgi:hypothetical protein
LSHLYIKCIILPRQVRDEHRENSKKVPFSLRDRRKLHFLHEVRCTLCSWIDRLLQIESNVNTYA